MNKKFITLIILFLIFIISIFIFLFLGLDISHKDIILSYIRIPALIKVIIAGSSLALAGMFLQAISKNPLADPYLTGLSSGAGLGIALALLFFNGLNYSLFGFVGALIAAAAVIFLSGFSKFSITKLILIGLSINLFTSSIISFLILTNQDKAYAMTLILTGGFSSADVSSKILIGIFVTVLVVSGLFINKLNLFRLDTKLIFSSENEVYKYNIIFVILSALLTSISVYTAGILGFIGIIAPLLSIMLLGRDYRFAFFGNVFIGSILLLISNIIS
ncbi:MAG: iron ABC transporter permease, partial [Candidatus Gastranaerophilales bacterium]|nr:iron ABC transporter permease [Candidatus Gastranaerophilales bacterium]